MKAKYVCMFRDYIATKTRNKLYLKITPFFFVILVSKTYY